KNTYGNDVVNKNTYRWWFSAGGFKKDEFSLKDERRTESKMLKKLNSEQLQVAIDESPTCLTRELSKTFHVSRHMTIYREMKRPKGKISKTGKWVLHDLSEINKQQRVICCLSPRSRELQAPFLNRIITNSDKKWILYNKIRTVVQSQFHDRDNSGLHMRKIILCVWRDLKGIVYYELMGDDQTIKSEVYCHQLARLKAV
ncbi:unnamed protein product, partial [Hymenolepis diminuta]